MTGTPAPGLRPYELRPLASLVPYANNSRKRTTEDIAAIAAAIREFGFTNPVLIDEHDNVIAGHGRIAAADMLSLDEVPCLVVTGLSEAQRKALVIADNQLAARAGWDESLLMVEIGRLSELDFDIDLLGFDGEFPFDIDAGLDEEEGGDGEEEDEDEEGAYSRKVEAPIYEPTGECPATEELYDRTRTAELLERIEEAELPEEVREFLYAAAERHTVFRFDRIAEFYAHAGADVQELFEDSALVVIDFNRAIEQGFIELSAELKAIYADDDPEHVPPGPDVCGPGEGAMRVGP